MLRKRLHRTQQAGFLMLELTAMLSLVAVLGVYASKELTDKISSGRAEAAGVYNSTLKDGLDEYLNTNARALANATAIPGFSNPQAPTVLELRSAQYLPAAFPLIDPFRRRQLVAIDRTGCPGATCTLTAYSFSHVPLTTRCTALAADGACQNATGDVRYVVAEEIRTASRGYGATISLLAPTRLRGSSCDYPAPAGAGPGTYGICTTRSAAIYAQFVRIGDDRNPDLQGDLSVVGKAKSGSIAVGAGTTETTTISSVGDVTVRNGTGVPTAGIAMSDGSGRTFGSVLKATSQQTRSSACATTHQRGDMAQDASGTGLLMCNGSVWVGLSNASSTLYSWCPTNDELGSTSSNQAIICSGNRWVLLSERFGKRVFAESFSTVNGSWVPKPACVSGTIGSMIILVPKNLSTDAVKLNYYAVDYSSQWAISIVENTGSPIAGEAIAQTYCIY